MGVAPPLGRLEAHILAAPGGAFPEGAPPGNARGFVVPWRDGLLEKTRPVLDLKSREIAALAARRALGNAAALTEGPHLRSAQDGLRAP